MTEPTNPTSANPDVAAEPVDPVAQLTEEKERYLNEARRIAADFDNYQKRAAREREQERKFAMAPLARDILPAIDNLDRFLANVQEDSPWKQIVATVRSQLVDGLKRHGFKIMDAQGQPFDPQLHDAVMQQPDADHPPGTVLKVLEAGYHHHDRVLRPARVVVSKEA
jgi:molecular chaperone GrpE